jgi:hypothetical protein
MPSNVKAFVAALQRVEKATKKPAANIVNGALKDVAFRAMSFTPYADPGKIQAELYRDKILIKLAVQRLVRRSGKAIIDRRGNSVLTARGRQKRYSSQITPAAIGREATKILKRRINSSRAARAGWIPSVRAFGGSIRGGGKLKAGSSASKGGATKATVSRLKGVIRNALMTRNHNGKRTSVENISEAVQALEKAVAFVTADKNSYARSKEMRAVLRKASDR